MIIGTLKSKLDKLWLEFWASSRLNMRFRELREPEFEQGSQPRFPSSSHVVHQLTEAHV